MSESQDTVEATLGERPILESRSTTTENPPSSKPFRRPVLRANTSDLAGNFNGPSTAAPGRRLPPLLTNPDVLASLGDGTQEGEKAAGTRGPPSFLSRQGPASAAAYVPPIGHSHAHQHTPITPRHDFNSNAPSMPSITEPSQKGSFTAAPGPGGSEWTRQKELIIGSPSSAGGASGSANEGGGGGSSEQRPKANSSGPFATAVGVPLPESWPTGGGLEVGLAMHQQQQIQLLQAQMQHAMQIMRSQVAIPPAGLTPSTAGFPGARGNFSPPVPYFPGDGVLPMTSTTTAPNSNGSSPPLPTTTTTSNEIPNPQVDQQSAIATLIATKGYNPPFFNLRPVNVRPQTASFLLWFRTLTPYFLLFVGSILRYQILH